MTALTCVKGVAKSQGRPDGLGVWTLTQLKQRPDTARGAPLYPIWYFLIIEPAERESRRAPTGETCTQRRGPFVLGGWVYTLLGFLGGHIIILRRLMFLNKTFKNTHTYYYYLFSCIDYYFLLFVILLVYDFLIYNFYKHHNALLFLNQHYSFAMLDPNALTFNYVA